MPSRLSGPPARVQEGRLFQLHVQVVLVQLDDDLVPTVMEELDFGPETELVTPTDADPERGGRADFFGIVRVAADDPTTVVIDEMKASRWERMTPRNRRRNIARYARQTWRYINSIEAGGFDVAQAAVHFPWCDDAAVRAEIEHGYTSEADERYTKEGLGLSVVWWGEDQQLEERTALTFAAHMCRPPIVDAPAAAGG